MAEKDTRLLAPRWKNDWRRFGHAFWRAREWAEAVISLNWAGARRLERSLREVVRRHEILRASFAMADDQQPMQKVVGEVDIRLRLVDLRELEAGEREKRARKIVEEEAGKGFDLRQLPLFRGVL